MAKQQKPFKPAKTGSGYFPSNQDFSTKRGLRAASGIIDDPFLNRKEIQEFRESIIKLYGSMDNYIESLNEWPEADATAEEIKEEKRRRNR